MKRLSEHYKFSKTEFSLKSIKDKGTKKAFRDLLSDLGTMWSPLARRLNELGVYSQTSPTGDVSGPASAVNDDVVFFDGTTGKLIKDSGLTLSGTNTGDQDLSGLVPYTGATEDVDLGPHNLNVQKQIIGAFGSRTTSGTLDWNDVSNARSGNGYTLLFGDAANGPGPHAYFHSFSFEYGSKDGTGNLTQFAIPYGIISSMNFGIYMRGRYGGTWTNWMKLICENNSGNVGIGESAPDYKLDVNGTFGFTPGASVTPVDVGDVVIETTNDTTLTFKLKGSDGVVRSGTLTLA